MLRRFVRVLQKLKPSRRTVRLMLAGLVVVALAQLLYPRSRVLPAVTVRGYAVGFRSVESVSGSLERHYQKATLTLHAGKKTIRTTLAESGVHVEGVKTAQAAADYPFYLRLVPLSSLALMLGRDTAPMVRIDNERLQYFADQASKQAYRPAVNASIIIKKGDVQLVPAQQSREYPPEVIAKQIRQASFSSATNVEVQAVQKPANRTDDEVRSVLGAATRAVDRGLTLKVDGKTIPVDKATIGGWLEFTEDPGGNLELTVKEDALRAFLKRIEAPLYKAPGTTKIRLVDGQEVGRSVGQAGRGIAIDQALQRLRAVVQGSGDGKVDVPVVDLPPKVVYERKFTNAGLDTLLNDIVKAKGDYAIAVVEPSGRKANANGTKQYTAASTYKLFVAYAVFKEIDAGAMQWSDPVISGYSVEKCFEVMIVNSDNPCPKTLGERIGWEKIDAMVDALGLTSTQVQGGNHLTTANDLALFLSKLENGNLVASAHRTRLLDAMKRQIYRNGIPSGTGVTVANKVGFLLGLLHDAGIVYGPKKPYILVILSDGSSWSQVADAAKQIHGLMKE